VIVAPHWIQCGWGGGIRDLMSKIVKFYSGKNPFGSKIAMLLSLGLHKHEGSHPSCRRSLQPLTQTRTSNTSKYEISFTFFYYCGKILPTWIRIQPTKTNADPDPQNWLKWAHSKISYCHMVSQPKKKQFSS
jgi:hypothetical protein